LWIGTPYGLSHLQAGKVKHYTSDHGLAHNTVRSVLEDSSGKVWVGTHGGLQRIEQGEFFRVRYRDSSSLEQGDSITDLVYDIQEDREGNIWAGTSVGLKRFRPKKNHRLLARRWPSP
ncbi:MAG: two-component regulator propeller domain-containing protein, partial [Limisphaerales bacterium]